MKPEIRKSFEILELKPATSIEELKQAYRELVKVWHPDRFQNDSKLYYRAQEKLKELNRAYELLSDFLARVAEEEFGASQNTTKKYEAEQQEAKKHATKENDPDVIKNFDPHTKVFRFKKTNIKIVPIDKRFHTEITEIFTTKPVSKETPFENASANSISFSHKVEPGQPRTHYDYGFDLEGENGMIEGHTDVYTFLDGSELCICNRTIDTLFPKLDPLRQKRKEAAKVKNWKSALQAADEYRRLAPSDSFGWFYTAYALHELKQTREALELLQPVVSQFKEDAVMRTNLACYECSLGNLTAAKSWLKEAKKIKGIQGKTFVKEAVFRNAELAPLRSWVNSFWF